MPVMDCEAREVPVEQAAENLRVIRDMMERSTKHSTFSGLSGVLAGSYSIIGALLQWLWIPNAFPLYPIRSFLILWSIVIACTIGTDFLLTKRKAARVGKTVRSRLGRQMILAAGPALFTGALLTLVFAQMQTFAPIYPLWMLSYGTAICAVGLFSQKEVSWLGWAFLTAGFVTLALQVVTLRSETVGLAMTALSFGGFHIVYGIAVSRRDGW